MLCRRDSNVNMWIILLVFGELDIQQRYSCFKYLKIYYPSIFNLHNIFSSFHPLLRHTTNYSRTSYNHPSTWTYLLPIAPCSYSFSNHINSSILGIFFCLTKPYDFTYFMWVAVLFYYVIITYWEVQIGL